MRTLDPTTELVPRYGVPAATATSWPGAVALLREDEARLRQLVEGYEAKYGEAWRFEVHDNGSYTDEGGTAHVFRVTPTTAFGFAKGEYSQSRW
nr:hypothetical protein [Micromonospora sp. DSM 115978]